MTDELTQVAMTTWRRKICRPGCTGSEAAELHAGGCRCPRHCGQTAAIGQAESERSEVFQRRLTFALLLDRDWLDEATKTIDQFWKRKNARRNGLTLEKRVGAVPADS
jgi:hypothetical protein